MNEIEFQTLVRELTALPRETEWVEFKHNKATPEEIGEYISALSNSATLHGKPCAYILWGVEDGTRRIIGTTFRPHLKKVGNEELENWLLTLLEPSLLMSIHEGELDGHCLVLAVTRRSSTTTRRRSGNFGGCWLGIKESSYPLASKIISEAIGAGLIRLHSGTRRDANYVPFWA